MSHKFPVISADLVHCYQVGTLGAFQEKLRLANDPEARAEAAQAARAPTTLQKLFGLPERISMRMALGI